MPSTMLCLYLRPFYTQTVEVEKGERLRGGLLLYFTKGPRWFLLTDEGFGPGFKSASW